jgi:hypothetical protein
LPSQANAHFTAVQIFPEFSSEVRWNCTEQGLLSSEYAKLNLNMPGVQFETVDFSGVTLPPADQWQIGTSWESNAIALPKGWVILTAMRVAGIL